MQLVIEVAAIDVLDALDRAKNRLAHEPEYGGAGAFRRLIGMSSDATRRNPDGSYVHRVHLEVEDHQEEMTCEVHGRTRLLERGSSSGFAGGRIYYEKLACGDVLTDESDDVRAAY